MKAQRMAQSSTAPHTSRDARSEGVCGQGEGESTARDLVPLVQLPSDVLPADLVRFGSYIEILAFSNCWRWKAALNGSGYPMFLGKNAHRISFEWFVGPIADGLQIDHLCRNTWCVNPAHLEAVTPTVNTQRAKDARKECRNGHAVIGENIRAVRLADGRIHHRCAICHRISTQRSRERRRAVS